MFTSNTLAGATSDQIKSLEIDMRKHSKSFLGYPIATDFDYTEMSSLFNVFLNNIGDPNVPGLCRLNTKDMEQEVIGFYAKLLRAPTGSIWGYVTSGSTEGNLYGLWVARERYPDGIVYHSAASHYSIVKNIRLLRTQSVALQTNPYGELDYDDLRHHLVRNKTKPAIIVANIGTTMTEARDDIAKIRQTLEEVGIREYHIHCDAALVGSYGAFIDPRQPFDFADGADTITVSAYKFLGVPQPCGIVLVRKLLRADNSTVSYIASPDNTISGSRSGHTPLMIWYRLKQLGEREGLQARYRQSASLAEYTSEALKKIDWPTWRNPGAITTMLAAPPKSLVYKWQLAIDNGWCHIICAPGITKERIDAFIADLYKTPLI